MSWRGVENKIISEFTSNDDMIQVECLLLCVCIHLTNFVHIFRHVLLAAPYLISQREGNSAEYLGAEALWTGESPIIHPYFQTA
jgi:hypothetical protein